MFNIGGGELIVIMLIALIVLGPQRLPDAARQLGKVMGDLRRLSTGFQNEMKQALDTADDPNRITARRNVLAVEPAPPTADPASDDAVAGSIASVSAQPSAPAKPSAPAAEARPAAKKAAKARTSATTRARPPRALAAEKNSKPVKKAATAPPKTSAAEEGSSGTKATPAKRASSAAEKKAPAAVPKDPARPTKA